MHDRANGQMGIAAQVAVLDHHVAHGRSGLAAKAAAEIVGCIAEPAVSREGFDLPRGAKGEVAAVRRYLGLTGLAEGPELPAVLPERCGEPVVEATPAVAEER